MRVFELDRNGGPLSKSIQNINKAEADEFNDQEWYKKFNENARKSWKTIYELRTYNNMDGRDKTEKLYYLKRTLQEPFVENVNTKYYIAKEIFSRLYGHEFEYDKDFNPLKH